MSTSQIPPIVRSLPRHRLVVSLLVLQVLITTAAITNIASLFVAQARILTYETGLTEPGLGMLETEFLAPSRSHDSTDVQADLETLRQVPGIASVAAVDALPLSQNNWTIGITDKPLDQSNVSNLIEVEPTVYSISPGALQTLGITLAQGNDFPNAAYVPMAADQDYAGLYAAGHAIVSEALARRLYPHQNALGRTMYADGRHPLLIIGIAAKLARPLLHHDAENDLTLLLPLIPDARRVIYAVRARPDDLDQVLDAGRRALQGSNPHRMLPRVMSYTDLRHAYFRRDLTMALLFLSSGIALLIVTGIGIYGLASFWVRRRYRQIGIRRALGARSRDIVNYFLLENLLLSTLGVLLGAFLAAALNTSITQAYGAPRIEPIYLALGPLLIILLGQAAAWIPARRAARNAPIISLRS